MLFLLHALMRIALMIIDGAAQWFATTLRLPKEVVRVRFAQFNWMQDSCAHRARVP